MNQIPIFIVITLNPLNFEINKNEKTSRATPFELRRRSKSRVARGVKNEHQSRSIRAVQKTFHWISFPFYGQLFWILVGGNLAFNKSGSYLSILFCHEREGASCQHTPYVFQFDFSDHEITCA